MDNQAQAAIQAGYSARSAYSQASRLLKKDKIKEELLRRQIKLDAKVEIKKQDLIDHLVDIALDAKKEKSYSDAIAAIRQISKMLGYDEPSRVDLRHRFEFGIRQILDMEPEEQPDDQI